VTPDVTVVIPVLDAAHSLPACLDALAAQVAAPPFEVVVVDNGSTDSTAAVASDHPVTTRVLYEGARGPYAARNTGIADARGSVVALTDADCVPDARWLRAAMDAIDGGADLVAGAIVQRRSSTPTVWERYDRATYLNQERFVREQGFGATANLVVRADVFRQVGVFVPALVASGDLEFGNRAVAAGLRLVYADNARVVHQPRATLRDTWALHRKLGSGFAELAAHGLRGRARDDLALRIPLDVVWTEVASDGGPLRRRQLAPVHAVAMAARWTGRLTGRG
jgi:glycosyltransferase involved in cell wall biosynthesis